MPVPHEMLRNCSSEKCFVQHVMVMLKTCNKSFNVLVAFRSDWAYYVDIWFDSAVLHKNI